MRVKRGVAGRRRHKKIIKQAKGFRGRRNNCYKLSKDAVEKAMTYAYRDRRLKKRDFRKLWIARINAAARLSGLSYSRFMSGLQKADVELNRKMLSEIAIHDPAVFAQIVDKARSAQ